MPRRKRNPDELPVPERVLNAAERLFANLGYENTSMKAIGAEADVTAAAFYYHFKNKQDILFQTLKRAVQSLVEATEAAVAAVAGDAGDELAAFVRCHVMYQARDLETVAPTYAALVYGSRRNDQLLSTEQAAVMRMLELRHLNLLRDILRRGVKASLFDIENITISSFAIIGMCEHIPAWAKANGPLSPEQIAELFERLAAKQVAATKA